MVGFWESSMHRVEFEVDCVGCGQLVVSVVVGIAVKFNEYCPDAQCGFVLPKMVNECDGAYSLGP